MSVRLTMLACCLLIHLGTAELAVAESPPPSISEQDESSQRYRSLINDALTSYEEGRFVAALALFERAHALRPNARAMRGIALVLFELGDQVRALRAVDAALSSDVEPLTPELREQLIDVRRRAASQVERVALHVAPAGASVRIDGREVPADEFDTIWLPPGTHRIETTRPGFALDIRVVDSAPGGSRTVSILLTPAPPTREDLQRDRRRRLAGWGTTFAIGLTGTAATLGHTIDSSQRLSTCRRGEQDGATCITERLLRRERALSLAAAALGVGLTVTAAIPLWRALKESHETRSVSLSCALADRSGSCHAGAQW